MFLNASSFWLCCFGQLKPLQWNKIQILEHSKITTTFFPIIYILFVLLQTAKDLSLLKYFKKSYKTSALDPCNVCESMKKNLPNSITANDLEKGQESSKVAREEKKKRTVYTEKDKQDKVCGNF